MEIIHKLKPHFFITPHRKDTSVYCPACGQIMEKVLHTPKNRKPVYLCPNCNTITPNQVFTFLDLK